jgi:N-acetylmuramoyl-L-alanine amidase
VLIPLDLVSDRFAPKGSEPRRAYEEALGEAKRLRKQQVRTKGLEGVVVVLDPGHGGRDQGGSHERSNLYEDELNYDVACRVKKVIETRTRAKVYMTVRDLSSGYEPVDSTRFVHDTDEEVLTTPPYDNYDAKISANLRWYLANAIYFDEVRSGADPRKIIFTSFHTDALFDGRMRGAMVYIPGAKYRHGQEKPEGEIYARFKEAWEHRGATTSAAERRRDEALSRNFAEDLMQALGKRRIRRHLEGPWIRSQIRQDGGLVYVPAVLRNTLIPTKVLVETANLTNQADRERLADPNWRQNFAEAYVDALKTYFSS